MEAETRGKMIREVKRQLRNLLSVEEGSLLVNLLLRPRLVRPLKLYPHRLRISSEPPLPLSQLRHRNLCLECPRLRQLKALLRSVCSVQKPLLRLVSALAYRELPLMLSLPYVEHSAPTNSAPSLFGAKPAETSSSTPATSTPSLFGAKPAESTSAPSAASAGKLFFSFRNSNQN